MAFNIDHVGNKLVYIVVKYFIAHIFVDLRSQCSMFHVECSDPGHSLPADRNPHSTLYFSAQKHRSTVQGGAHQCSVQCTSVQCTPVQCTVHISTVYSVHQYSVQCTLVECTEVQ